MRALTIAAVLVGLTAAARAERFYFRGGVLHVAPQPESNNLELSGVMGIASLAVQNGPIAGSGTEISST